MKAFTKLFSVLLLICVLFCCAACANDEAPNVTTDSPATTAAPIITTTSFTEPEPPAPEPVDFKLTSEFVIVRPAESDEITLASIQLLGRGIKSAYDINCSKVTDVAHKEGGFEILVGKTSRAASQDAFDSLAYYDHMYKIVDEKTIVICGGSSETVYAAVETFLSDILGYKENAETEEVISKGNVATLTTLTEKTFKGNYPVTSIKIGNTDFSEYSIVVADDSALGADTVNSGFSRLCGKKLSIISFSDYKSGPAIFFGCINTAGEHYSSKVYGNIRYFITESDGNIFIDFKNKKASEAAAERFITEYLPKEASGSVTVELKGAENLITGVSIASGTNGLVLQSTTSEKLAQGVYYKEYLYANKNGSPVRAHMVAIKKGSASFTTLLPENGLGSVANVSKMIKTEQEAGVNVIAGINADFYDIGATNIMRGLCVKNGEVLHPVGDSPWFGVTTDGEAVLGVSAKYRTYAGKLHTGVGGSNILLQKDAIGNLEPGTDFGYTRHPRTAVGITPDGDVILLVVDGRQPEISNGASLSDLAYILASLGCSEGINLDGGGSSTLITCDSEGNTSTKNSPSDGWLRSVADGLGVVLP